MRRQPHLIAGNALFEFLLKRKASLRSDLVWVHHPGEGRLTLAADSLPIQPRATLLSRGDRGALDGVVDALRAALTPHRSLDWIENERLAHLDGVVTVDPHGTQLEEPLAMTDDRPDISAGAREGLFLYELVRRYAPRSILELGTAYGIGTMYILAATEASLVTVEGDPLRRQAALASFERHGLAARVESVSGWFPDVLPSLLERRAEPFDFVYEDGPHIADVTWRTFTAVVPTLRKGSLYVLDDVHHIAGNDEAWERIQAHESVVASAEFNGRQGVCVIG
ncbi:MAG TPA: class I SAM-dependent methyltransferase [Gaiellaceae bacterium]